MKILIIHLSHVEDRLPKPGRLFRYPETFVKALSTEPLSAKELARCRQVVSSLENESLLMQSDLDLTT